MKNNGNKNNELFRGLALPINGAVTPDEILDATKLNWKVCGMPILIQGSKENRTYPNRKALVRCDNGFPIDIVSDRFHIHQNQQIVSGLVEVAKVGGIELTSGGSFNGGADVFLHGSINRQFDVAEPIGGAHSFKPGDRNAKGQTVGDIVRLDFTMRGGHRPGAPTTLSACMMRLICTNSATAAGASCTVRQTHRRAWEADNNGEIEKFMLNAIKEFETYEMKAKRLMGHAFSREMTRAFVIELLQPELLLKVVEATSPITTSHPAPLQNLTGAQILDSILSRGDRMMYDVEIGRAGKRDEELKLSRSTKAVLEAVVEQPGYELAADTAWGAYNAVTYYVDHVRGRGENADSAVESAMSGEGARMKSKALELAIEYTERGR